MKDPLLSVSCLFFLYFIVVSTVVKGNLYERLHHFETLHHLDVKVIGRQKRDVDGSHTHVKDVSFSAFGRSFNLILTPGSPVIGGDLNAIQVFGDGRSAPLRINENQFFTGHLAENVSVKADAHTEDGLWTANIYEKDDVYILEPSQGHLPPSDNHSMIVYRQSDIKWENIFPDLDSETGHRKKMCSSLHPEDEEDYSPDWELEDEEQHEHIDRYQNLNRTKRAASSRNTCHIIAVADYTFYNGPGGGFPHQTANYLIQTLQKVNRIFKSTIWNKDHGLYDMGFQIKELRVHSEPTDPSRSYRGIHYNMDRADWVDNELLRSFGEDASFHNFCLAHLFTFRQFAGGVLGLAYIAPPRKYAVGGICSNIRTRRAMNTGFSSAMNTKGYNLLTQEAVLVTTHEFGHNWGAEHDAETKECAPSSFNDGKFLMYPYAVSGFEENNYHFSPCSKRYITSALVTRSGQCFKQPESQGRRYTANVPMCGNGIIDKGEDCDGGSRGLSDLDPCCDKKCKYKGNAVCSSTNYECCQDCQIAPAGKVCRGKNQDLCQEEAECSGLNLDCPNSKPFPNDTKCIDEGQCVMGQCLDFCRVKGLEVGLNLRPCQCEQDRVMACKRCCKAPGAECTQYGENLQNGRPCGYGYCEDGYCKTAKANMIKRLFSFIENLDSSTLVAFMKANIVGTIIVFSLVIWVPVSWIISFIDKRHEKKQKEQDPWLSRDALLNMSLQSHHFTQLEDYKVREPPGRFRATMDMRGRPYWGGGASAQPLVEASAPPTQPPHRGAWGGGDRADKPPSYEEYLRSPGRRPSNERQEMTYKPRGDGDGPLEFESRV